MKLYTGLGPNPRTVRMFLAEKGVTLPLVEVDLLGGENRRAPYTDKNPAGQLPCFLFAFLDFGRTVAQPLDPNLTWINGWFERVAGRPSATA